MIDSLKRNVFLAVILGCAAAVLGQPNQGIVRIDLKDRSSARNGLPETLPVYVEIATVQPDVEQGIVFTLNIENNSDKTVRVMDPIDTARISLLGRTNPKSKSLRNIKPDFALCISRPVNPEQVKALSDNKKARRPFQAFETYGVRRNRRLKTVSDIVPWKPQQKRTASTPHRTTPLSRSELFEGTFGGMLTLEPGQRFQAVLQINRVQANFEAHKKAIKEWRNDYLSPGPDGIGTITAGAPPRPEPEIIPIPSGKYSLRVSIIIVSDYAETCVTSFDKRVTIQLGEPDISKPKGAVIP